MFGYVRPILSHLSDSDREAYQRAYCGLCHALGKRYGFLARFALTYDFVFLAILLSNGDENQLLWSRKRCPLHPWKMARCCLCGTEVDIVADISVILMWYKMKDDVQDSRWFHSLAIRFLCLLYWRTFHRACENFPDYAMQVRSHLNQLHYLESKQSKELDQVADSFASILQAVELLETNNSRKRAMEQLLYHLGRWIYLVDAFDDLMEDQAKKRYNPLNARFYGKAVEEKEYIATTMTHSLRLALSAANLLEFGMWGNLVDHMLSSGLPSVQELVLSGNWRKKIKPSRRENVQ